MKRLIAVLLLISLLLCGCDILETQKTIHEAEEQLLRAIVENKELQNWLAEHPFDSVAKDAKANLEGATKAGLEVGAYFFSQALNEEEVHEEIDFMLEILGDTEISMPVVFDWEYISAEARTANMDDRTLTDLNLIYCERMEKEGYQPMIYFNSTQARTLLFLHELEDYPFWLAYYSDRMTYPYRFEMWQYSCTGRVPGIQGDVDLNILLLDQKLRPQ